MLEILKSQICFVFNIAVDRIIYCRAHFNKNDNKLKHENYASVGQHSYAIIYFNINTIVYLLSITI